MEYFYFDVLDQIQQFTVSIDPQNFIKLAPNILDINVFWLSGQFKKLFC